MTPLWLNRLNDLLAWLNPVLCLIAGVLAAMVVATAAARGPGSMTRSAVQWEQPVQRPAPVACSQTVLPPELQDMLLHD
jgi:hypothetical protein